MRWGLEGYIDLSPARTSQGCTVPVPAHAPASTYRSVAPNTRGCRDRSARWREAQRFYPVASHLLPPPSSLCLCLVLVLALPRTAPANNATRQQGNKAGYQAVRLSGHPAASACTLPSRVSRTGSSFYTCTYGSTTEPAAYQSVSQPGQPIHQPTGRAGLPEVPKWVKAQQGSAYCLDEAQS